MQQQVSPLDERDYYTFDEMAQLEGISRKTLQNRLSAGKGHPPVYSPARGVHQFPKKDYARYRGAGIEQAIA